MKSEKGTYKDTFCVPRILGKAHLEHKIRAIEEMGGEVVSVMEADIPQAGSRSTPYANNYLQDEPGWLIVAEFKRKNL